MLFDLEKRFTKFATRQMAEQSLEQKQRDVYDSHRHRVFSVSYYMTGSELEAEDLLRNTFVRAFREAEEPDHAIVDTALVEELKEQEVLEDDSDVPAPPTGYLPPRHNILRTELEESIRCLPSTERLVFLLMDVEGYPAKKVAELLNLPDSVVLRTALNARLRIRAELAGAGEEQQAA